MSNEKTNEAILLALHRLEDHLSEIAALLRISNSEKIRQEHYKVLASPLRKKIYELCDGKSSVGQIASKLGKSIQQVSNNIMLLQTVRLIEEVRKGKEKYYVRVR